MKKGRQTKRAKGLNQSLSTCEAGSIEHSLGAYNFGKATNDVTAGTKAPTPDPVPSGASMSSCSHSEWNSMNARNCMT